MLSQSSYIKPIIKARRRFKRPFVPKEIEVDELSGGSQPRMGLRVTTRSVVEFMKRSAPLKHLASLERRLDAHHTPPQVERQVKRTQGNTEWLRGLGGDFENR